MKTLQYSREEQNIQRTPTIKCLKLKVLDQMFFLYSSQFIVQFL